MAESQTIYKVLKRSAWESAVESGLFAGAEIDIADGYIHFSSAQQVVETVKKHFAGQTDLLLIAFDSSVFGDDLKWEPSRGGDLFPHLYGTLNPSVAQSVFELPLDKSGNHVFPEL